MEQTKKDKIAKAARAFQIGTSVKAWEPHALPRLTEAQKGPQEREYSNLLDEAKRDLISVLEILRVDLGPGFDFKLDGDRLVTTLVREANGGELKGRIGVLFYPPKTIEDTVSPPAMAFVLFNDADDRYGMKTRGIYFENESQAERAISVMSVMLMEENEHAPGMSRKESADAKALAQPGAQGPK